MTTPSWRPVRRRCRSSPATVTWPCRCSGRRCSRAGPWTRCSVSTRQGPGGSSGTPPGCSLSRRRTSSTPTSTATSATRHPVQIPVRRVGDGRWPVPGWDPRYGWRGTIPFRQLPWTLGPARGDHRHGEPGRGRPRRLPLRARGGHCVRVPLCTHPRPALHQRRLERRCDGRAAERHPQPDSRHAGPPAVAAPPVVGVPATGSRSCSRTGTGPSRPDSAAAAYFNVVWRDLLELTFQDQLPEAAWPDGGERWFAVVEQLLERPDLDVVGRRTHRRRRRGP